MGLITGCQTLGEEHNVGEKAPTRPQCPLFTHLRSDLTDLTDYDFPAAAAAGGRSDRMTRQCLTVASSRISCRLDNFLNCT